MYFDVRSKPDYGKLSGRRVDDMREGYRIEPGEAKRDPLDFARLDLGKVLQFCGGRQRLEAAVGRCFFGHRFDQGVPVIAPWALTLPFRAGRAAFGAAVNCFDFCHYFRSTVASALVPVRPAVSPTVTGMRGANAQKSS